MRHQRKTVKLGRKAPHRDAMLANQVCSLIAHRRIKTTLAKAKATRSLAEKMITLGKKGTLHARRIAISYLRDKESVKKLFEELAPAAAGRQGGYTRIIKLGPRQSDSAPMAFLEWVDEAAATPSATSSGVSSSEDTADQSSAESTEENATEIALPEGDQSASATDVEKVVEVEKSIKPSTEEKE